MWVLATAVLTASVMGSLHCVGMCGPLAIWASGSAESDTPRRKVYYATGLYHTGRLITYLLMGLVAGVAGELIDVAGHSVGIQVAAARLVGAVMIVIGLFRFGQFFFSSGRVTELAPSRIGGLLVRLRPYVFSLSLPSRALATGLLTTFLPCGWLYLFAFIATGTGSVVLAPMVMGAFWLGSVPALVGLVAGTGLIAGRLRTTTPLIAAVLLIAAGCYTMSGRGFDSLDALTQLNQSAKSGVQAAGHATLPCCLPPKSQ